MRSVLSHGAASCTQHTTAGLGAPVPPRQQGSRRADGRQRGASAARRGRASRAEAERRADGATAAVRRGASTLTGAEPKEGRLIRGELTDEMSQSGASSALLGMRFMQRVKEKELRERLRVQKEQAGQWGVGEGTAPRPSVPPGTQGRTVVRNASGRARSNVVEGTNGRRQFGAETSGANVLAPEPISDEQMAVALKPRKRGPAAQPHSRPSKQTADPASRTTHYAESKKKRKKRSEYDIPANRD